MHIILSANTEIPEAEAATKRMTNGGHTENKTPNDGDTPRFIAPISQGSTMILMLRRAYGTKREATRQEGSFARRTAQSGARTLPTIPIVNTNIDRIAATLSTTREKGRPKVMAPGGIVGFRPAMIAFSPDMNEAASALNEWSAFITNA